MDDRLISKILLEIFKNTGMRGPEFRGNVLVIDGDTLNVCSVDGFDIQILQEMQTNGDESRLVREILGRKDIKAVAIPRSRKGDYNGVYGDKQIFYL